VDISFPHAHPWKLSCCQLFETKVLIIGTNWAQMCSSLPRSLWAVCPKVNQTSSAILCDRRRESPARKTEVSFLLNL